MQVRIFFNKTVCLGNCGVLSRLFLLACITMFAAANNILATPLADSLPPLHEPRPHPLDIQHIALDLRFDFAAKQAFGTADITLAPLAPTETVSLDAAFMRLESVQLQTPGGAVDLRYHYLGGDGDDNLRIQLPRPLAAGEQATVRIAYRTLYHNDSDPNNLWGSYGKGLRFFSPSTTEPRKRRQIWSMGEPQGNRYWFPGLDAPGDARTCELRLTVPGDLIAVSVGRLLSQTGNADGTTTFHWYMDQPHFNHQTSLVVGAYQPYVQSFFQWQRQKIPFFEGGRPVSIYHYGYPDEQDAVRASVVRLPEMLGFFSGATGQGYPYLVYNQVFVQDFPWGGGHNIGTATISENMVDDYRTHADFFYLWDGVAAQDLAAQWFGNWLTPADWSEVWLSKSFALYFDCLFTEYKNGREEMLLWNRNFQLNTCQSDWQAGIKRPVVTRHYDDPATMCFDNFSLRGALVLHLLRQELGEKKWRKTIWRYVKENAGKAVTTADFQAAAEAVAGRPLDWFFEQWLYTVGQPDFEVEKQYDPIKRRLNLRVRQVQQPDAACPYPQTRYFQGKMAVEIDGRIENIRLEPREENVFVFKVSREPKWVNFDVENTWIKTLRFEKTRAELLNQFLLSRDVLARRAAMLELAGMYAGEQTNEQEKADIATAFRRVITSQAYWRLRYQTLLTLQNMLGGQRLDPETEAMLLHIIQSETSWMRAGAITFLGTSKDPKYAPHYRACFNDESERVVNAAANALGQSKAEGAYEALVQLKDKPSWKNQSLISALNGLRALGDPRAAALALEALRDEPAAARWTLATPVWDFRLAAAETLAALGKGSEGYPVVYQRLLASVEENDKHDVFSNVLLLLTLGDARALEIFPMLKEKYSYDTPALQALENQEAQLRASLEKQ